ncbi:MAG: hypothetical protein [Microvirus sp.]|nr:MAG: hypothetical protein [Microvirus sp.]
MDSKELSFVCTIYDIGAKQHGPIFVAPTLPVMWRNIDNFLSENKTVSLGEFAVVVHGECDFGSLERLIRPYSEPLAYSCADRTVLSFEGIRRAYEGMVSNAAR